jgi:hypothetical protein
MALKCLMLRDLDDCAGDGIQRNWRKNAMRNLPQLRVLFVSILSTAFVLCGCHGNQQTAANSTTQADDNPATDNLAPVADTNAPPPPGAGYSSGSGYAPDEYDGEYSDQGEDTADESYYGVEPVDTAPEPPPPLPEYDQPPCPGDDYEWTPGYWDYASTGYYWVPGVWVEAPYAGALWTPGYWGYSHGHYAFFSGYWGRYVGFYGGINYGFGYTGVGYQGGYWNGGHFDYNRSVNNVNVTVVHNVYNRTVVVNRTTIINNTRVSYNGGSGGITARPQPAELAALREPHAAPMQTQVVVQRSASENRAQFAAVNRGRPAQVADTRPVTAVANVRPAPPTNIHNLPATARPPAVARNQAAPANRPAESYGQPNRPQPTAAQPNRPEMNAPQPNRAQPNPTQASRPEPNYVQPSRPQVTSRPQVQTQPMRQEPGRAAPQARPEAQPSRAPATQPRSAAEPSRPAPAPNREAPSRPAPTQNHAAPAPKPAAPPQSHPQASHPAPEHNPPPKDQKDEHHPQ